MVSPVISLFRSLNMYHIMYELQFLLLYNFECESSQTGIIKDTSL